jgi:hypothetical protein
LQNLWALVSRQPRLTDDPSTVETDPVTHDDFADETDCLEGGHSEKGVVLVLHELEQGRNEFGPPLDGQLNRRDRRDDLRGDASCLLDW